MVLHKRIMMWVVGLFLIFVAGGAVFIWLYSPTTIGYGLKSKVCTLTEGILSLSSCTKPSNDAYQPCSSSEQCKNGCFLSSSAMQLRKQCQSLNESGQIIDKNEGFYQCPPDIKLKGECAPLDKKALICSNSTFFDSFDYQLIGEGKAMPVRPPFGLLYSCGP